MNIFLQVIGGCLIVFFGIPFFILFFKLLLFSVRFWIRRIEEIKEFWRI
jgi:hypothetical protein